MEIQQSKMIDCQEIRSLPDDWKEKATDIHALVSVVNLVDRGDVTYTDVLIRLDNDVIVFTEYGDFPNVYCYRNAEILEITAPHLLTKADEHMKIELIDAATRILTAAQAR